MARISLAQSGYVGYPYRIFLEMTNYGRGTQTHLEKMVILEKWYSHLRAALPVLMEKKLDEYNKDIAPLLADACRQIEIMNYMYESTFEGVDHCNPAEKEFIKVMRGVFERLDYITAKTKLIDKQKGDDEAVFMG